MLGETEAEKRTNTTETQEKGKNTDQDRDAKGKDKTSDGDEEEGSTDGEDTLLYESNEENRTEIEIANPGAQVVELSMIECSQSSISDEEDPINTQADPMERDDSLEEVSLETRSRRNTAPKTPARKIVVGNTPARPKRKSTVPQKRPHPPPTPHKKVMPRSILKDAAAPIQTQTKNLLRPLRRPQTLRPLPVVER